VLAEILIARKSGDCYLSKRIGLSNEQFSFVSELGLPEVDVVGPVADVLRRVRLVLGSQLVAFLHERVSVRAEPLGGRTEGVRGCEMILKETI